MMLNHDSGGWIFLSALQTRDIFFLCILSFITFHFYKKVDFVKVDNFSIWEVSIFFLFLRVDFVKVFLPVSTSRFC